MAVTIPFPLPATGFALNSKVRVNLDFIVSKFNEFNTGTATWDGVYIGTGGSVNGALTLYNSTNGFYTTLRSGVATANQTYTLPTTVPAAEPSALFSTTAGVMGWKQFLGTGNQVSIANNAGNLTFSLPQNIDTAAAFHVGSVETDSILVANSLAGPTASIRFAGSPTTGFYLTPGNPDTDSRLNVLVASGNVFNFGYTYNRSNSRLEVYEADPNNGSLLVYADASPYTPTIKLHTGGAGGSGDCSIYCLNGASELSFGYDIDVGFSVSESKTLGTNTIFTATGTGVHAAAGKAFSVSGSSSGTINISAPATVSTYTLTLPSNDGVSGQSLITNGSGATSWGLGQFPVDIDRCGFTSPTGTTISFNDANFTFTLADAGSGWSYYHLGVKYSFTGNKTVVIDSPNNPPTTGFYYIYFTDGTGTLTASTSAWTLRDTKMPVASIYWNNSLTPKYILADERHTCLIDKRMHFFNHNIEGTKALTVGALTGPQVGSDVDANKTFGFADSEIADEDLNTTIAQLTRPNGVTTTYPVIYRTAASTWVWVMSNMPFRSSATYLYYDNAGTQTVGNPNKYINSYLCFGNIMGDQRFFIIQGQNQYSTLIAAQAETPSSFGFSGFPVQEYVVVYQFTWDTSAAYSSTGKCELSATPKRVTSSAISTSSSAPSIDHNSLGGLQGGTTAEYYHLTSAQHTIATQAASASVAGYVTTGTQTFAGAKTFNEAITLAANKNIILTDDTTNTVNIALPTAVTSYTLTLPANDGDANQVLTTDGSGNTSWATPASSGANTALSNLASVAINADLIPTTDNTLQVGTVSKAWEQVHAASVIAGLSGRTGVVTVYPATAAKGYTSFTASNNSGDTQTIINTAAQAAARTYTIPDAGASASFVMTEGSQTINGVKTFGSPIIVPAGSLSDCSVQFVSDPNTGLYSPAANTLYMVTNGSAQLCLNAAGDVICNNSSGHLYTPSGSSTDPGIAFNLDANTGISATAADTIALLTGGATRLTLTTTELTSTLPIVAPAGTKGTPGLTFAGGAGFYTTSSGATLNMAVDNSQIFYAQTTFFAPSQRVLDGGGDGVTSIGGSGNYFNDINYKSLVDRGCIPWCDDGVELGDGTRVSDLTSLCMIEKHPTQKTIHGLPKLNYKTFPKKAFTPSEKDPAFVRRDENGVPWCHGPDGKGGTSTRPAEDGVEMTMMFGVFIGAFKELKGMLDDINARIKVIEDKQNGIS
jgi:hypothetical protein